MSGPKNPGAGSRTKPQLLELKIARAATAGILFGWIPVDEACGGTGPLRAYLEERGIAYVLVLACAMAWSVWLRHGRRAALVVVPVIPILWVNLHGGSALAFVACLLALAVAVPVGDRWGTWPRRPARTGDP